MSKTILVPYSGRHFKYMTIYHIRKCFLKINFSGWLIYLLWKKAYFAKNGDIFSKKYRRLQNFFPYIRNLFSISLFFIGGLIVFNIGNSAVKLFLLLIEEREALQLPCARHTVFHFDDYAFVRHVVSAIR